MDKIFFTIINMSLTGSLVIMVIIIARLLLKKIPKVISYCLWVVAGFRLIFPFTIESVFGLIPRNMPEVAMPVRVISSQDVVLLPTQMDKMASADRGYVDIIITVWIIGTIIMLIYGVAVYSRLKYRLRSAILVEGIIYETDAILSPFVLGMFKPKIYVPLSLSGQERDYVIFHEQTHITRGDHIIKLIAYFILCLHWFNPLTWVAFLLMVTDMEMSCDERVLLKIGRETRVKYSTSLLSLAGNQRLISGTPLAFSEWGLKARIKNVLNFHRPSQLIITLAAIFVIVLSIGFAMNQSPNEEPEGAKLATDEIIIDEDIFIKNRSDEGNSDEDIFIKGRSDEGNSAEDTFYEYITVKYIPDEKNNDEYSFSNNYYTTDGKVSKVITTINNESKVEPINEILVAEIYKTSFIPAGEMKLVGKVVDLEPGYRIELHAEAVEGYGITVGLADDPYRNSSNGYWAQHSADTGGSSSTRGISQKGYIFFYVGSTSIGTDLTDVTFEIRLID